MSVKFSNNGHSTLAASLTSSGTSITVASGHGARFPSLSSGEYFYATLIDASNNLEIVKVSARSTDVLTVTRAQEGTTARAYAIGDRIELRVTAQGLADLIGTVDLTNLSASSLTSGTLAAARIADDSIPTAKLNDGPFNIVRENVTLLTGFNTHASSTRIVHRDMSAELNSKTIGLYLGVDFQYNASANYHGYLTGYYVQDGKGGSAQGRYSAAHYDWYYNRYEIPIFIPWDGDASNQYLDFYTTSTHFTHTGNTYSFYYRGRIDRA